MDKLGARHQVLAQDLHADLDRGLVAFLPVLQKASLDHHLVVVVDEQRISLHAHDAVAPVVEYRLAGEFDAFADLHDAHPAPRKREREIIAIQLDAVGEYLGLGGDECRVARQHGSFAALGKHRFHLVRGERELVRIRARGRRGR